MTMREAIKMNFFQKLFGKKIVNIPTKEKTVNVLVMGKAAVGKTSLIRKLAGVETFSEEHNPTLYDDLVKEVNVDEYNVSFRFMELGGTQAFPTMQEIFIQQADMYILVYSADDVESYSSLLLLREKVVSVKKKCYSELPIIVVRNKVDIRRRRSRHDKRHKKSVANWCYLNHDVSAKSSLRVNSIMENLIEESKFIGNEQDENNFHISGRYVYSEKHDGQSELYHKAPGMFNNPDNSDEKMKERRMRLQNRLNRRNVSSSMVSLKRSLSLTSLRRSMRKLRRKPKDSSNRDSAIINETLSVSNFSLKQSSKSLNLCSSTLLENSRKPCDLSLRASTLPDKRSRESYIHSCSAASNSGTPIMNAPDLRRSLINKDSVEQSFAARREKSRSLYLPRTCNSLVVPNQKDQITNYGSCSEISGSRNISLNMNKLEITNKSSSSINKSVLIHDREQLRPKLSRQFSTDQGSLRDISDNVKETRAILQRTSRIHGSSQLVSCDNNNESGHSRNSSLIDGKDITQTSVDPRGYQRMNSPEYVSDAQQSSVDSSHSKQRNSSESLKDPDANITDSTGKLNVNNIRASNSPQVLRSIPVMRRKSLSENDVTDMFTVNIPEPKRKPSSMFKNCKPNRKSSPTNNSPKIDIDKNIEYKSKVSRNKTSSTERKNSGSSCSDKSSIRDSQSYMKGEMAMKYNGENEHKDVKGTKEKLLPWGSKTDLSQSLSYKLPLTRVRSKSSSEVQNSSATDKKSASFVSSRSYSGSQTKRSSWNGRGFESKSKQRPKSILKNNGEGTATSLKVPLRKMDSLSHDDIRNVSMANQDKFIPHHHSNLSTETSKKSNVRIKSTKVNKDGSPIVQAKRWLQSVAFTKAIDE